MIGVDVDFGSADGCYNPDGPLTGGFVCSTGWTVSQVNTMINDADPDPQIYEGPSTSGQPEEWTQLCVYNVHHKSGVDISPLDFDEVLPEPTKPGFLSTGESWSEQISIRKRRQRGT